MPEKIMTLDEIKRAALNGQWGDALCWLVEHVRALTPKQRAGVRVCVACEDLGGACDCLPTPAPVSPRAEALAFGREVRIIQPNHTITVEASDGAWATKVAAAINRALADAEERGKALGFEAGRRKGLEEAARVVARFPEYDNVRTGFSGLIDRDDAAATVRSLIGGDK